MRWIKWVHKLLELLNLKGGVIMGFYSFSMIGLSFYSVMAGKPIDGSVAAMYSTAALAFAGSRAHKNWLDSQSDNSNINIIDSDQPDQKGVD
jgi:hypothetical protein